MCASTSATPSTAPPPRRWTTAPPSPRASFSPATLVFFNNGNSRKRATHVGIYIGGNQFVHASTPTVGVIVSDMDSAYYGTGFVGARRLA